MDFKNILHSLSAIAEGETKETDKGRVHKGEYGNKYGKEDVRDQYGHKIGKKDKGEEAKKDEPKKGRGRPKKDADASGEVKKYDTKGLHGVFGGGQKPKKEVGKVSKKHSLKEYIEEVADSKAQLDEGVAEGEDDLVDLGPALRNLTGEFNKFMKHDDRMKTDPAYAKKWNKRYAKYAGNDDYDIYDDPDDDLKEGTKTGNPVILKGCDFEDVVNWLVKNVGPITRKSPNYYNGWQGKGWMLNLLQSSNEDGIPNLQLSADTKLTNNQVLAKTIQMACSGQQGVAEAEQVTIAPAQQNTQVIKQGNKTLGTVTNPQLANQIKQSIGKGEMTLAGDELTEKAPKGWEGTVKAMKKHKDDIDNPWALAHWMKNKGYKSHKKAEEMTESFKFEDGTILTEGAMKDLVIRFIEDLENGPRGYNIGTAVELKDKGLAQRIIDKTLHHGDRYKRLAGTLKGQLRDAALEEFGFVNYEESLEEADITPGDSESIRKHTQHGLNATVGNKDVFKPSRVQDTGAVVKDPTPWSVDPINAFTDRAINKGAELGKKASNFIAGLRKPTLEGQDMKDVQMESWEKQLNGLLNEGITVSSSTGQQGSPDSLSITATDTDAQSLMSVLRNAGIGGFGAGEEKPEIGYGVALGGEEEPTGTGTVPQPSPEVVGDGDDMLSLIKKMTGIEVGNDEGSSEDYADEEDTDEPEDQTLEPADSDDDHDDDHDDDSDDEEQTDEGNAFTGKLAQTKQGEKFKMGDKTYTDKSSIEEDEMEEGNAFGAAVAKAKSDGIQKGEKINVGGKEYPVKEEEEELAHEYEGSAGMKEGEETCNECGMYESHCSCDQVNEFANDAGGNAKENYEYESLKALMSDGDDLHKVKRNQNVGNITPVSVNENDLISQMRRLSGIK